MKIQVGIVGNPHVSATLYLDQQMDAEEMQNITPKNVQRVGLAIARRRLGGANVYPVDVRL